MVRTGRPRAIGIAGAGIGGLAAAARLANTPTVARNAYIHPKVIDLTPRGIRTHLDLNKPIYSRTAAYGHFGRAPEADGGFSWERTDLAEALKKEV